MYGISESDIMNCEIARTGHYGEDFFADENFAAVCPECGAVNPDTFYTFDNDIIGCSGCISSVKLEDAITGYPKIVVNDGV